MQTRVAILIIILFLLSCKNNRNKNAVSNSSDETLDTIKAKYLYSAEATYQLIQTSKDIVIFEVSPLEEYNKGHLPGAFHIWRPDYSDSNNDIKGLRAPVEKIELFLSNYGVTPESKIVIYDNRGNVESLRLLWILEMYGHENMIIIDGAKKAWKDASLPLTSDDPKMPSRGKYTFDSPHDFNSLATFEDVQKATLDTNIIILDTREPYEYLGKPYINKGKLNEYKPGAFIGGRIINAKHLNWSSTVDLNGDHKFKSISDVAYDLQKAGISKEKEIIVYCQSGVRSSHTAYVLKEIMGFPKVKNYDGSWIEWSYNHVHNNNARIEGITIDEKMILKDSLLNLINNTDE